MVFDGTNECTELADISECVLLDALENFDEIFVEFVVSVVVGMTEIFDIFRKVSKQEDVVFANLTRNLDLIVVLAEFMQQASVKVTTYIRTIACTNNETTIENKLHVTRSRGLCTGGTNVLTNITGWHNDLGFADVVILKEDDLE